MLKAIELGILNERDGNLDLRAVAQPLPPGAIWPEDILQKRLKCRFCGRPFKLFADTYHGGGSLSRD